MQNKVLLLGIYTEDEPSANLHWRWTQCQLCTKTVEKIKSKDYQNYICRFHYKIKVFAEPRIVAHESPAYAEHSVNNSGLEYAV